MVQLLAGGFLLGFEVFHIQNLKPFSFVSFRICPISNRLQRKMPDFHFCDFATVVRAHGTVHTQQFAISDTSRASLGSGLN